MKIIEDIKNYTNVFKRASEAKKMLETLKINWAAEPEEMQFDKLHSGDPTKGKTFKEIGTLKLNSSDKVEMFQTADDNLRYTQLIELIDKGEPIIPPLYIEFYDLIDGIEKNNHSSMGDGLHRTNLARHLGLSEIPIVIVKQLERCLFTPHKWKFESVEFREGYSTREVLKCSNETLIINIIPETAQPILVADRADMINIQCWGCRVEVKTI